MTAQKTSYTSWFDVRTWPISKEEPEAPAGMDASVRMIHTMLDTIVAEDGIPADQIVVGGFSQGGSLAIKAGGVLYATIDTTVAGMGCVTVKAKGGVS